MARFLLITIMRILLQIILICGVVECASNGTSVYAPIAMDATSKCSVHVESDNGEFARCESAGITVAATVSHNTTSLILSDNRIGTLAEPHFFHLKKLKYLNLQNNEIRSLTSEVFKGLANLEVLVLRKNQISTIGGKLFEHCHSLKRIDFSHNSIQYLSPFSKAMKPLLHLESVCFSNNKRLITINPRDLYHLRNSPLTQLNLGNCRLRTIQAGVLGQLKNLQHLILSGNWMSAKKLSTALTNISNTIDRIDLVNMKLTSVPTTALQQISTTKIRVVNFEGNVIKNIYDGDIPLMPSLEKISFKKCGLKRIDDNALDNLTAVEVLDLSKNHLSEIPCTVYKIPTLIKLELSTNVPTMKTSEQFLMSDKMFSNMTSLTMLNLNNLDIESLNRYALYGLSNLKNLSMRNSLTEIEEFAFQSLNGLEFLDLSKNEVAFLSKDIFSGLNNLTHLHMSHNQLSLDPKKEHFTHLHNLEELDLSHNKLTSVPRKDLVNLHRLKRLILRHNQIMQWSHHVVCFQNSILEFIDLHKNHLNSITSYMLDDFTLLKSLDISNNPFICSTCEMFNFAEWTLTTETKIKNKTFTKCSRPKQLAGKLVVNIKNPAFCINAELPVGWLVSGLIALFILTVGICVGYYYRWYIRYYWFLTRAKVHRIRDLAQCDNFKYDAFVSYNAHDREWVIENMISKLEHDDPRLSLCLHERDFEIGREIWSNIVESIDNSRKIVVILTDNFLSSQWCTWEMNMAQFKLIDDNREALILILLEKIDKKKMTSTLRYILRTRTYLEWTDNVQGQKLFWERLKFALQKPQCINSDQMVL